MLSFNIPDNQLGFNYLNRYSITEGKACLRAGQKMVK